MFENLSNEEFTMVQNPETQFSCVNNFYQNNGKKKQIKEKLKILKVNDFLKSMDQGCT